VAAVFAAQLRQPHIGAFGDEHGAGIHAGRVRIFVFVAVVVKSGTSQRHDAVLLAAARSAAAPVSPPEG